MLGGRAEIGGETSALTFNRDIAPLLFAKCVSCHRSGQHAPMSLLTYKDVRPWAQAIRTKVIAREMPPWFADPRFGEFSNSRALTQPEIDTIAAWVDGGAPEGSEPLPPAPPFADGWTHPSGRAPDIVLEMPLSFEIPAQGVLPPFALYSALPPELSNGDHFVEAVQLLPSNPSVVHHSAFSMRALPAGVRLGTGPVYDGGPVLSHVPLLIDRTPAGLQSRRPASAAERFSTVGASHFVFYFPGNNGFAQFAPGTGKRIRPQDFIEWSVHYTPSEKPQTDRERVGLWLQRAPSTHEVLTMRLGDFHIVNGHEVVLPAGVSTSPGHAAIVSLPTRCGTSICAEDRSMIPTIPPRASNWKITGITPFQDDVTLYQAYPHGHLRLADLTYVLTYPDGREETILSVPKFRFDWQLIYRWAAPLRVPAGSTIKAIGHYDNTAANRFNPSPDSPVQWGEQTTDEMFNAYVDLSIDNLNVQLEGRAPAGRSDPPAPRTPIVTVVGCVSRSGDRLPMLTRATAPAASSIVHADAHELAEAAEVPLGVNRYQLIGAADFESPSDLLAQGQRALFTRAETANTTGSVQEGRKLAVKGLLIAGTPDRLNVLSAHRLADVCP
jgi:hypothetical protein